MLRERPRPDACTWLLLVVLLAPPASGLDLVEELRVYHESFEGELTYPTDPELDAISGGGMIDLLPGLAPTTLLGSAVRATVVPGVPYSGIRTQGGPGVAEAIAVRGLFSNADVDPDEELFPLVAASFDTPSVTDSRVFTTLGMLDDSGGDPLAELQLYFEDASSITFLLDSVSLPTAEAAAVLAGGDFTLDVAFDFFAQTVVGSVHVEGFAEHTTSAVSVAPITDPEFTYAEQVVYEGNPSPADKSIDFEAFEIYRTFTGSHTVSTTADAVDLVPGDGLCQTSSNECSLRAAIQESNATPGAGEVILPAGTYVLQLTGTGEDAAASGDLDIDDPLVLRGDSRFTTVVDGNASDRVFDVGGFPTGARTHLLDLTIRNGAAVVSGSAIGGGVRNTGDLVLRRCIVSENVANLAGGVMNYTTLLMEDCVVRGNEAQELGITNPRAGGLASASTGSSSAAETHATIRRSAIVENLGPIEGGVELGNCESALLVNTTIAGNENRQLSVYGCDVSLQHTTIVAPSGDALTASGPTGTDTLSILGSAVSGASACSLGAVTLFALGINASNDFSCGFTGPGSLQGVPLGLLPLAPYAQSYAHLPGAGSPLRDGALLSGCPSVDQVGTQRPLESDGVGVADCELGAIELPEPASSLLLAGGVLALIVLRRRRGR